MSKMLKVVGASWMQTKISSYILGLLGILAILALFIGQLDRIQEDGNYAVTLYFSEKTGYRIEYWGQSNQLANIPLGVARAYIRRDVDTDGWYLLEIETNASYDDEIQAYGAGVVEGALTWSLIHSHLENTLRKKCQEEALEKECLNLKDFFEKSVNKWKTYADERANVDPFWHHVHLYYTQINGIYTGWQYGITRSESEYETDIYELYWLNSMTEIPEIQRKLNLTLDDSALDYIPGLSSAFLRIVNETSNDGSTTKKLYVAQNAAGSYYSMTRILKRYKLNYRQTNNDTNPAPGLQIDFSGYPGAITSLDEFYLLQGENHRIAVTGTSLRNYNDNLWKEVNITEQVPIGPRITAANHLATNVSTWGHILASDNSGTACKQWLVVDYNVFDRLHDPAPKEHNQPKDFITEIRVNNGVKHTVRHTNASHPSGLLWLIEQVPRVTYARDLTMAFLEQGYWATYGLPQSKNISEITHVTKMYEKFGKLFSVTESPRAKMFKEGYENAKTMKSIIDLMRDTNLTAVIAKNETCLKNDLECIIREDGYWAVVGVRGDIVNNYREPYGVIDTKVVSGTSGSPYIEFIAIAGPPYTEEVKRPAKINKGNVATIYTDQFNNKTSINGLQIHDLIQKQEEEKEQQVIKYLNKDAVKPFVWSESEFDADSHEGMPDKWAFGPYKPKWSW